MPVYVKEYQIWEEIETKRQSKSAKKNKQINDKPEEKN